MRHALINKMHAFFEDYNNRSSHKTEQLTPAWLSYQQPIQIHAIAREAAIADASPESQEITPAECTLWI